MFVTEAPFSSAGLDAYRPLVGDATVQRIRALAEPLRGARVLHVNATPVGGGVAELLLSLVPLLRDVGLDVDWYVLEAESRFFEITKQYHNALQGQAAEWSQAAFEFYWEGTERNARVLERRWRDYDFVVVHDPQPMLLRALAPDGARWIWRCHIDMTAPTPAVWSRLSSHLAGYDLLVFSAPEYVPDGLDVDRVETALPCIDPFRAKNWPLADAEMRPVLARYGIDPDRPYLLQVSRFDRWKDPVGVIRAYQQVKERRPETQLAYMASMAMDDPEAREVYREAQHAAGDDPDVHLLAFEVPADAVTRNAIEVNAMQRGAAVVLQKSTREGFGLTVTEALWKRKAVVAGNVGGIRYQICDGWNGYLVDSVDACADRVSRLLEDPDRAALFGDRGRRVVQTRFLFTRLLEQYLMWFRALAEDGEAAERLERDRTLWTVPGSLLPTVVPYDRGAGTTSSARAS